MLKEFDLSYNLEGKLTLTCHDGLGEEVHRLFDEELFLHGNFTRQDLTAWSVPRDLALNERIA